MLTEALLTIARMWKKNGLLIHATIWRDLENIMLSEISQTQRD